MARTTPRGTRPPAADSPLQRQQRRRQLIVAVVVAALVLSSGGAVVLAIVGSGGSSSSSRATTTSVPTRPTAGGTPVDVPLPAPGATATQELPCPPADGSAERTTTFIGSPPVCLATANGVIDTSVSYRAVISTSVGDLTYLLTTAATPQTVNSFVVLARYGYWNGAPFDSIVPLAWAETGARFTPGASGVANPGWDVPRESSPQGMVSTPGMLGMATTASGDSNPGRLVLALGDGAGDLPVPTTFFGVLLDGTATLAALQRAGTTTGAPSQVVTIDRITIEQD